MSLPLFWLPGFLTDMEWPEEPLQLSEMGDSLRILEEHPTPFPKFKSCRIQVPPWLLGNRHYEYNKCWLREEQRIRQENLQHCFEATHVSISINAESLETAVAFPYLLQTVGYNNSDRADLYQNIRKARRRWGVVAKVVTKTGAMVQVWALFYKAFVQTVLLYGSDRWLVTGFMLKVIEGFHHWAARMIAGKKDRRTTGGEWECPPVDDTLETAGLWPIKE